MDEQAYHANLIMTHKIHDTNKRDEIRTAFEGRYGANKLE